MIDLQSAECIVRAAHRAVEVMAARIAADPASPLVPDLQRIAEMAQHLINESRTK
jgi:hypothetical protein